MHSVPPSRALQSHASYILNQSMQRRTGGTFVLLASALGVLTLWATTVGVDRMLAYSGARTESRSFVPAFAGALREGRLDEAVKIADRYTKSHLAKVAVAGVQEFRQQQNFQSQVGEKIDATRHALDRAQVIVHADMERGVPELATIAVIAPLIGLLGTLLLMLEALRAFARDAVELRGRGGIHRLRSGRRGGRGVVPVL